MSADFDGNGDSLTTNSPPVTAYALTLATWFKRDVTAVDDMFVNLGVSGTNNNHFRLSVSSADKITSSVNDGVTTNSASQSGTTTDTTSWHHACAVFTNATNRAVFFDGGSKGTTSTNITPTGISQLRLGRTTSNALDYDGKLAHVAIWNTNLSDGQVASLAAGANPLAIQAANLVAYWPLTSDFVDVVGSLTLTAAGQVAINGDNPTVDAPPAFGGVPLLRGTYGGLLNMTGGFRG